MDYLKTEAPFWKQECFADASAHWVEAKTSDQAARQRWQTGARRIGALVLAGGEGRRMDRRNKGLQSLHGQPLVRHVVQTLRPQVDWLAISANHDLAAYQALGLPVFSDEAALLGKGPLAGLASALPHIPPDLDALLIAPCDTPLLPTQLVARLGQALFAPGAPPAVMAATADGPHPSILLLRPALLLSLPRHLQQSEDRSLRGWLAHSGCARVFFDDAQAFININDLQTLAHLQTTAAAAPLSHP
ncbi:molybdenum cofactor guanylyltransferase [Corticibacter populi]|uniref:Molybdenum cofactor guanylyltransferase n=2 Tax=Corticibacter populi TaxID=1550736 RepID=A0A3M6QJ77_9BURK|nr:molybdenum cofactor guanylyltransferase [Corticibacter populi]